EAVRVANGVRKLDVRGPPRVLEVVDGRAEVGTLRTHVGVPDAPEVQPEVRELVEEERTRIDVCVAIERLPAVRRREGVVARRRERVCGRAEAEDVEEERLAVAVVAPAEEAFLRRPPVRDGVAVV